jgi:hypothetical protein
MKHLYSRRSCALLACATLHVAPAAQAVVLARFNFENEGGIFTRTASVLDSALTTDAWLDDDGSIVSGTGNPGFALSTRGFNDGNTLRLRVTPVAGLALRVTGFGFDQRVSASGPARWQLDLGNLNVAAGVTTTAFSRVGATFAAHIFTSPFEIAVRANGASSALGTLRVDNFTLEGSALPVVASVPLPGAGLLLSGGLAALAGWRRTTAG